MPVSSWAQFDQRQGSGPAVGDSCYVWTHYTTRTLDQTIVSTNVEQLARQLSTYSNTTYYGSRIWQVDHGYLPDGLEEVVKTMRSGSSATVALPVAAQSHDNSLYTAFSSTSGSVNQVIEIVIDTLVTDIYDWQDRSMKRWFSERYAVSDTTMENLYFKKLVENTDEADTVIQGNGTDTVTISDLHANEATILSRSSETGKLRIGNCGAFALSRLKAAAA